ncbi:NAD+ diphosphatase [Allocatelliglobosispora scoriae]|uniref:NAD(+) diphosphatase n=1 Tax=Allocatelliglobosispora scoriae TaxID=643052 RepID=A0A841BW27_9ACTN|nr:NAD(+) diphosphatase [Allocatelliglobosispora scoriae]MBB5871696.1 NAD+ diphosphatase [Allocatelliglobosispora scoriae]
MTSEPTLARSTLDRAAHHRVDPQWLAQAWEQGRVLVIGLDGRALVRDGALVLLDASAAPDGERLFLGIDGGVPHFAVCAEPPAAEGAEAAQLYAVASTLSSTDAGLFTTALALVQWHLKYQYSPMTGAPTSIGNGGWVRYGPEGEMVFPRTDPAVIVLVHDGVPGPQGRIVLGRNAAFQGTPPRYSILAGFVEPGESAEAAAHREVGEEVGVQVTDVTYVASESWPFPRSLMLGFTARAELDAPVHADADEILHARWFTRTEIAAVLDGSDTSISLPSRSSIAYHLVTRWLAER